MFDPTAFIYDGKFGYICCHTGADYMTPVPWRVLYNPLRWTVGIGRRRPCRIVLNRNGWMQRKWSNFNWWLWKRRYREIFGWPDRRR